MGKIVVKRFMDDSTFGLGSSAMARWANTHNARVISQSASKGWLTVTFEIMDNNSQGSDSSYVSLNPSVSVRTVTDEELWEMNKANRRRDSEPSKITVRYLDDAEIAKSNPKNIKPKKKRWWKRG